MSYVEAILICNHIDEQTIGGRAIDMDDKLAAVEKILGMATIIAVPKDTLLKIVRWFWDHCVEEAGDGNEN